MTRDFWHHIQYLIVGILGALFAILYSIAPNGRHEQLGSMMALCVGFMVGKWTNERSGGNGDGVSNSATERRMGRYTEKPPPFIKRYAYFLGEYVAWLSTACTAAYRGLAVPRSIKSKRKSRTHRPYAA